MPMRGHVDPTISIAQELQARGFEVVWYIAEKSKDLLGSTDLTIYATQGSFSYTPLEYTLRKAFFNYRKIKTQIKYVFADWPSEQIPSLEKLILEMQPDLILTDCIFIASLLLAKKHSISCVVFGLIPFPGSTKGTNPFGPGFRIGFSILARFRNRIFHRIIYWLFYKKLFTYSTACFAKVGVRYPERKYDSIFNLIIANADLYLQGSHPLFEYPFVANFGNVSLIGPVTTDTETQTDVGWAGSNNLIFITQGTVDNSKTVLVDNAITGLKKLNLKLLVLKKDAGDSLKNTHAIYRKTVSYKLALSRSIIFITNGGFGGVNWAIQNGVPIIVAGRSDDKGEVGARVEWSGIGINLRTSKPSKRNIRRAVLKILFDKRYRANCETLKHSIHSHNAASRAADQIEALLNQD